eukprot:CAMPEP_0175099966 /NCGR_PEP_ID=MMETSP0086_2-20121207/6771_1 /TAXON_ID=136419 /ORGANISM="Unknown Unknown, Strain D1" /LENGTH=75 /DNA_ID=CAMNT_0016373917 /DNA_START=460 /DNA_END=687 /DNA_ORIENTATION=+
MEVDGDRLKVTLVGALVGDLVGDLVGAVGGGLVGFATASAIRRKNTKTLGRENISFWFDDEVGTYQLTRKEPVPQ